MKFFTALTTLVIAAAALPTDFGKDAAVNADAAILNNGTRVPYGQAGFATLNGATNGGAGGAIWTVWDAWALRDAINGNERRTIYVRGRIDLTVLFTGSPGVILVVGNLKSIIGGDVNAMIFGGGLKMYYGHQVIIQNIKFHNALSYAVGEQPNGNGGIINQIPGAWSQVDAIDIEGTDNVWIDHCEFADDPWIAANIPDNARRHDGLIDIKSGSNWISISNSILRNHNLVSLIGHDDGNAAQDIGKLKVTLYLNWFQGTIQRNPRVRYGEVHILNNLFTDIRDYAIGAGAGARLYVERNVFINTRRAWGYPAGIPNPMGYVMPVDNWLLNSANDAGISNAVNWQPSNYYWYSPMAVGNVEWHVRTYSGTHRS